MLRTIALGSGIIGIIPSVSAASPVNDKSDVPTKPPPMKCSELPIYDAPHADYGEYVESLNNPKKQSYIRTLLHPPVRVVRQQTQAVWEQTESIKHTIQDNYNEFMDRTDWIVKYMREEDNKEKRYGAVVMGGVTGFIFGLRGGIFRRVFYAGIGATAMSALCFPEETQAVAREQGLLAKQYINIAYNFLYGVKPGDPQLEVKFPEMTFPKNFSEFVDMGVSLASSIKQAVMPPPAKDMTESKTPEKKE